MHDQRVEQVVKNENVSMPKRGGMAKQIAGRGGGCWVGQQVEKDERDRWVVDEWG